MATFTTTEANAAVITRSQPAIIPVSTEDEDHSAANHQHFCVVAKHANYKSIEFCLTPEELAWDADAVAFKAAVVAKLETLEAKPLAFKTRYDEMFDTAGNPIAGQALSAIT